MPRRIIASTESAPAVEIETSDTDGLAPPSGPLSLVSVVVACHGQLRYTRGLVASLAENAGCKHELILVDNGCPEGTADWAEGRKIKVVRMHRNAGVPLAYNAGVAAAKGGIIALFNNDMLVRPGGLEKLARWSSRRGMAAQTGGSWRPDGRYCGETHLSRWADYAGGYCLTFPREVWEAVGEWDKTFFPSYCLVPETPILKADLTWAPIGELEVGDELIGVDEHPPVKAGGTGSRSYRSARVVGTSRMVAECLKITLEDGRSVVCTPNHKWLSKCPAPNNTPYQWRQAGKLKVGYRIMTPLDPWEPDTSYLGGWLAGIFDGEGHLNTSNGKAHKFGMGFCQKRGLVLDQALRVLASHGITCFQYPRPTDDLVRVEINRRRDVLRTLGTFRPTRLLAHVEDAWQGRRLRSRSCFNDYAIVSIEPVGLRQVVDIETTTHTYIANGMVSHNSDDADWVLRARLKGYDFLLVPDCVEHFGQATSGQMDLRAAVVRHQEIIAERYLRYGLGQRIMVRRWAAAGDVLMTTPALRALKAEMPLARLHVQAHAGPGALLRGLPYVDHVFSHPASPRRYTRTLDLDDVYEAPQKEGKYTHPALAFCQAAGALYDGRPYDLRLTEEERAFGAAVTAPFQGLRLIAAGIRSGTRDKQNMRAENWRDLADALPDWTRLVLLDSAARPPLGAFGPARADRDVYEHPRVIDLTGQTRTLRLAAAIVERCDAFVGVDSALLHVAAACGKPVVNLCAAAPEKARTPLTGRSAAFQGRESCFPCQYRTQCPDGRHCLDWVPGAEAAREALRML